MDSDTGWECQNCSSGFFFRRRENFNTFRYGGRCPKCGVVFTYTTCLKCSKAFHYEEWILPYYPEITK